MNTIPISTARGRKKITDESRAPRIQTPQLVKIKGARKLRTPITLQLSIRTPNSQKLFLRPELGAAGRPRELFAKKRDDPNQGSQQDGENEPPHDEGQQSNVEFG